MPRSPFSFTTAGACQYSGTGNNGNVNLVPSFHADESFSGVSRRKPKGFIPATPYSFLSRKITYASGHHYNYLVGSPFYQLYSGVIGGGTGTSGRFSTLSHCDETMSEASMVDPSLRNTALIRARTALKSTNVNLGVAFAERSATARLVGDTASRLAKAYRNLRRGRIRTAMNELGISSARNEPRGSNAPQKWLELQYGWKPLLSDVYGSCDALSKRPSSDWLVTAKGRAKSVFEKSRDFLEIDWGRMVARSENSCFVRIDALPQNEALISLASLGITNPLLIGWELLPFSFVVDWFSPVGSYLDSVDALLGYETFSFSSSLLTRCEWEGFGLGFKVDPGPSGFTTDSSYDESKVIVQLVREVSSSVPFAHFPRFKDPRSLEHMANGLSLLAAAFGRK